MTTTYGPISGACSNAAARLDITEYELFHLAYLRWHGAPADEATLESHFVGYMFREQVPPWVRHFSRLVERLDGAGKLDRYELGIERLPRTRQSVSRGARYGVTIGLVLTALIVLAEVAAELAGLADRCMFPPCY